MSGCQGQHDPAGGCQRPTRVRHDRCSGGGPAAELGTCPPCQSALPSCAAGCTGPARQPAQARPQPGRAPRPARRASTAPCTRSTARPCAAPATCRRPPTARGTRHRAGPGGLHLPALSVPSASASPWERSRSMSPRTCSRTASSSSCSSSSAKRSAASWICSGRARKPAQGRHPQQLCRALGRLLDLLRRARKPAQVPRSAAALLPCCLGRSRFQLAAPVPCLPCLSHPAQALLARKRLSARSPLLLAGASTPAVSVQAAPADLSRLCGGVSSAARAACRPTCAARAVCPCYLECGFPCRSPAQRHERQRGALRHAAGLLEADGDDGDDPVSHSAVMVRVVREAQLAMEPGDAVLWRVQEHLRQALSAWLSRVAACLGTGGRKSCARLAHCVHGKPGRECSVGRVCRCRARLAALAQQQDLVKGGKDLLPRLVDGACHAVPAVGQRYQVLDHRQRSMAVQPCRQPSQSAA